MCAGCPGDLSSDKEGELAVFAKLGLDTGQVWGDRELGEDWNGRAVREISIVGERLVWHNEREKILKKMLHIRNIVYTKYHHTAR